ncbi:MAG: serine/threonine-protein kinase [Gordonia sp. (in: high G+C Gram-positive bacteria)]|uniref:serine/threonine-protein kinase n=1 Tax=Gordonia sp. (in: high G+C Gram-positive bacteria) TaxID=84139 RepID=UPI0039E466CD
MIALDPGDRFAGYTIERQLGAGSMSEVYLAEHPRLPRRDALKVLASLLSVDDGFRRRFSREADAVAALEHPNIVAIHDRGETDGRLWIALAYVDGEDLSRHLAVPLPPAEVADVVEQIAGALDEAARHGLIHRDVKPANIIRGVHGQAMLTDFGIAHSIDEAGELTGTGITMGSVAYASPEQLQAMPIDARADQYSLACTAFALLTGAPPYPRKSSGAVIIAHAHARDPIPSVVEHSRTALPAAVDAVFARAMAKKPADRYPDSRAFAADLATALTADPAAPPPRPEPRQVDSAQIPTVPTPVTRHSVRRSSSSNGLRWQIAARIAVGAALVSVLLAGIAAVGVLDDGDRDSGGSAPVVSAEAAEVLERARQIVCAPFVYNHQTVDTDLARTELLLTGEAKERFTEYAKTNVRIITESRSDSSCSVASLGLSSLAGDTAVVLPVMKLLVTGQSRDRRTASMTMTLQKVGDQWLISRIDSR